MRFPLQFLRLHAAQLRSQDSGSPAYRLAEQLSMAARPRWFRTVRFSARLRLPRNRQD